MPLIAADQHGWLNQNEEPGMKKKNNLRLFVFSFCFSFPSSVKSDTLRRPDVVCRDV
jgi:hypothetical protein